MTIRERSVRLRRAMLAAGFLVETAEHGLVVVGLENKFVLHPKGRSL